MQKNDAHVIFNGQARKLKFFIPGESEPRHVWECHDVGVNDANITGGEDQYGHLCKAPPGKNYTLGAPQSCATGTCTAPIANHDDDRAYGFWFTPINDDAAGDMAAHGRAGIGIHGGGSDLPDPFAAHQGWEYTFGCLRLQNADNDEFAAAVQYIQRNGGTVYLDIVWP